MDIRVYRVQGDVDRQLSVAAIRRDPVAAAALDTTRQFYRYLDAHGGSERRYGGHLGLWLDPSSGGAVATNAGVTLGSRRDTFRIPTARSEEVLAHELVHVTDQRANQHDRYYFGNQLGEGWADVIGNAFARSIDAPSSHDWKLGEGVYTSRAIPKGYIRDLANPKVTDMASVDAYLAATPHEQTDDHELGGIVTRAATRIAAATSPAVMGSMFTHAFLHDLPERLGASRRTSYVQSLHGKLAHATSESQRDEALSGLVLTEARAGARATLDAAARLHGPSSPVVDAVRGAWREAGIDARWSPREDAPA